jgi:hypothetical protein
VDGFAVVKRFPAAKVHGFAIWILKKIKIALPKANATAATGFG